MNNSSKLNFPGFVHNTKNFIPRMHQLLSGDPLQKIALSKSLSVQNPFIVPIEKADIDCITLEDFFSMLYIRLNKELAYKNEIIQLKDNICNEFNKLCDGITDEEFIKFARSQREKIINTLLDETKIEQKMIAERFYNDMINGWDEKVLNLGQFRETARSILWKPLVTPFPIKALDQLKNLVKELGTDRSDSEVERIASGFIDYLKKALGVKKIKDYNFSTSEEFKLKLEKIASKRKICKIKIYGSSKNESIINEFRGKCIEKVIFGIIGDKFLELDSNLNYDKIKLDYAVKLTNVEKLLGKLKKTASSLGFMIGGKGKYNQLEKDFSLLEFVSALTLSFEGIEAEEAKVVPVALKNLKHLSSLRLFLTNCNFGDEGVKALSTALQEFNNISTLQLYLIKNKIGEEGAKALSTGLKGLTNISTLFLDLSGNNFKDEGAKALSLGLKGLKNITRLGLFLRKNNIEKEGVEALSTALIELKKISLLNLHFMQNKIGDEGAKALSLIFKELKNISSLGLGLDSNDIGNEGAIAISAAINESKNIVQFGLDLKSNNIGAEAEAILDELQANGRNGQVRYQMKAFSLL